MAYRIPTFNLGVNVWRGLVVPPVGPRANFYMGNLSPGRRAVTLSGNKEVSYVLLPALSDVRCGIQGGVSDTLEVPAGSGRFYEVIGVEDVGKGFTNEYRMASVVPAGVWPVPYP